MSDPIGDNMVRTFSLDSEHDSVNSSDLHAYLTSPPSESESEDEELWLAKEMAMAIAKNPGMSPTELRELQDTKTKEAKQQNNTPKKSPKPAFRKQVTQEVVTTDKNITPKSTGKTIVKPIAPTSSSSHSERETFISPTTIRSLADRSSSLPLATKEATEPLEDSNASGTPAIPPKPDIEEEETTRTQTTTVVSTVPILTTKAEDRNEPRLSGIVWKRRSGFGKFSSKAAWERRRIVLKGKKLLYYPKSNLDDEDDSSEGGETPNNNIPSDSKPGDVLAAGIAGMGNWLENGLKATTGILAGAANNMNNDALTDGARGFIDLVKEKANIAASFGHSGAPTPFSISIKVLAQTRWKLCFDTQHEMMQWMAVLTDVIVAASVDAYNSALLQANDPKYAGENFGQLSEPPPSFDESEEEEDAGGHRLWSTGQYVVKSENFPQEITMAADGRDSNLNRSNKTLVDIIKVQQNPFDFQMDPKSGREVFVIPDDVSFFLCLLINLAIVFSRASSISVEMFWYILAFTNVALFVLVSKDRVGVRVLKPTITSKMAKALSKVLGITIQPTVDGQEEVEEVAIDETEIKKKKKKKQVSKPKLFKPKGGTTTMQIENHIDIPENKDGKVFTGWMTGNPSVMNVRSVGYKRTKLKVPSPGALYECVCVDLFEGPKRYPDMANRVELPEASFPNDPATKTWNSPDIFVISISIPTETPKLYSTSDDGMGFTFCLYYRMTKETRDILKRVTADGYNPAEEPPADDVQKSKVNAIRLFEEWCRRAPTDNTWMSRFKVIANGHNLQEIGLPNWIAKYNGKPFLIKRSGQTGFLYRHPEKSCIEFDVSLYPFPYIAKQGICFMKESFFKKIHVSFGFVIEGRSDDELPECLLGLVTLCYPDTDNLLQGEDFFAGKCPSNV